MSNFLAVATVTATLNQLLQVAVGNDVPGATVTMLRPDALANGAPQTGVNIYLYQVTPNASWRNADLPTRGTDGRLLQRPRVALDVHYLLTFYGDEGQLEPQRLLGSVVRTLHARPLLTRDMIREALDNPTFGFLNGSNLAEEVELVKFTQIPLSLEELSKLWSVFFQITYTLSVAYQGTVVLIESDETPQTALPVQRPSAEGLPFRQAVIEQVISEAGASKPIVAGSTILIRGRGLGGDPTTVRLGDLEVTPAPDDLTDTQIRLTLSPPLFPAGSLRAGVQSAQVAHGGFASNAAAFVLRPAITRIRVRNPSGGNPRSADIELRLDPVVGKRQRVVMLLNEFNPPSNRLARAYVFNARSRNQPNAPETSSTVIVPIREVRRGRYLVRVQVDGAESALNVDATPGSPTLGQYHEPSVTI